jgi:hypothetical protein
MRPVAGSRALATVESAGAAVAREQVTLRVVGAGVGRTGTHSLKLALERLLGAPCYHMDELSERSEDADVWRLAAEGHMPDWPAFFDGYAAAVDWPAAAFWPELAGAYPQAIVVLSVRESSEDWWRSADNTIFAASRALDPGPFCDMVNTLFARRFTSDFGDRTAAIAAYERHNAAVRRAIPAGRLVEWRPGDGWAPLCAALGLAVPDDPFPHSNTREAFRKQQALDP